jgi:hypothetical protein
MAYVIANGLTTEEDAPYYGRNRKCPDPSASVKLLANMETGRTAPAHVGAAAYGLRSYFTIQPNNKDRPLAEALQKGPVAVSAAASGWQEYHSGIFNGCKKGAVVDHAITLYGYGKTDNGIKYWNIQNSWGPGWGEKGYIRLLRQSDTPVMTVGDAGNGASYNGDDYCGWDHHPEEGLGCKGGPPKVWVCGMCGILFDSVVPHFSSGTPLQQEKASDTPAFSQKMEVDSEGRVSSDSEGRVSSDSDTMMEVDSEGRVSSGVDISDAAVDNVMMRSQPKQHYQD